MRCEYFIEWVSIKLVAIIGTVLSFVGQYCLDKGLCIVLLLETQLSQLGSRSEYPRNAPAVFHQQNRPSSLPLELQPFQLQAGYLLSALQMEIGVC